MSKYDHPLLQEVDYSHAKEPAVEMLLALQHQQDGLDWNAYLANPFQTPLFNQIDAIKLDEENEWFELFKTDGRTWDCFLLDSVRQHMLKAPGADTFIITMADRKSGLVGGYYLDRLFSYHLVFDRLLWDELGQPLDGRGFRLECAEDDWLPVVAGKAGIFVLVPNRGTTIHQMCPYFPDQPTAEALEADFSLNSSDPQECRRVSPFDLQVIEAVRKQSGWGKFSFADWQKAQSDMKEQLKGCQPWTLQALQGILPLQTWGWLDDNDSLQLSVQIPEQGLACPPDLDRAFYGGSKRRSLEKKKIAIEIVCRCLGLPNTCNFRGPGEFSVLCDLGDFFQWCQLNGAWLGGEYSKVAQMLAAHRLKLLPHWTMRSPNAHLLRDAEIDQWLPADFEVTDKNKAGFRAFLAGVLNDLRDLTAQQTAKFFKECLCSSQAQQIEFKAIEADVQLLDLMEDGCFEQGRCRFSEPAAGGLYAPEAPMVHHAWRCYDISPHWYYGPSAPFPFSWNEQVVLGGFAFCLPKSEAEYGKACLYCGLQQVEEMTLASGRIPPVIVSLAGSPRVPIGVVEPLSTDFELSEEFYQTLNEPKKQFDERFKKIVEQYWEVFDKKYPYLY